VLRLNADVGELPDRLKDGSEEALIALLDCANVACGGHAGSAVSMAAVVALCRAHDVTVGAHPSYPDVQGFGRRRLQLPDDALLASVTDQVTALADAAVAGGVALSHVKPHGALYHDVGREPATARVFVRALSALRPRLGAVPVVLAVGAATAQLFAAEGIEVQGEVFADRGVDPAGQLLPRGTPGALLSVAQATARTTELLHAVQAGLPATTLCVHGDGPNALAVARAVRAALGPRPTASGR
jgi:5-oxoprolinase (ATP-hydrolysing) subunit A